MVLIDNLPEEGTLVLHPMIAFQYTGYAQQVIFGEGSLAQLREAAERFHWQRVMLCASASVRRSGDAARVEAALGERLAACFDGAQPHVPDHQVAAATALASEREVEAVIGMGGGSPIGLAKAVSAALEAKGGEAQPAAAPRVPVIAIPTTYAGSEMTAVYGITRQVDGATRKVTAEAQAAPRLVLYDPRLTLGLPPDLTASTGMNALAHCVEAVYSIRRNPLSTAAALSGAQHIARALPRCWAQGDDLAARTEMLAGSYLAATALAHVAMGLHHGICHVLGGTAGVPHGLANAILLPHAMRFNLDATAAPLAAVAEALGLERAGRSDEELGEAAAQWIYDLVGAMRLPQHLREVGVKEQDLPRLAGIALPSRAVQNNPKPVATAAQIEAVLRAAW